jgi:hypothetical protein
MRIAAERTRTPRRRGEAVTGRLAVVLAIARMEWYFQRRSAAFWVVMTLIGAVGAFLIVRPQQITGADTPLWLAVHSLWIQLLLLPALVAALLWRTMHRDRQGTAALVLTRPVGAGAWVLGKTLGALFAATVLYLTVYAVAYAVLSVQNGEILPLDRNLPDLLLFWLSPIAADVVLYLLLDGLVAVPLVAVIPYLITSFGLNVLPSLWPGQLFLGSGTTSVPYGDLLLGSCLLWLGILCAMGALLVLCYRWRCRQIAWTRACTLWVCVLALIAGGCIASGSSLNNTILARLTAYPSPRVPAPPLSGIAVRDYQASISLLPDTRFLRGTVLLTVTSATAQPGVHAVLQFSYDPGLTVDSIAQGTRWLPLIRQPGLTGVTLSGTLPQTLRLAYHGTVQPVRIGYYDYPPTSFASETSGSTDTWEQHDAVGPDFTYLTSAGSWYPIPQVQSALRLGIDSSGTWLVPADLHWTRLSIAVPNRHAAFSSASNISSRDGTTTFLWQHPAGGLLPGALLAICPHCNVRIVPGGRYVAATSIGDDTARRDYAPLVPAYAAVRRIMDGPRATGPVTVVAVPMLAQSVGGGALAFVPEAAWDGMQPVWQMLRSSGEARLSDLQRKRIAISAMAGAWWSGNAQWLVGYVGYQIGSDGGGVPVYPGASSPYAAVTAQLAARLVLGDGYFQREQQVRASDQSQIESYVIGRGDHFGLAAAPAYVRQAAALGLLAEYDYFDDSYLTGVIAGAGSARVEALLHVVRQQQPILCYSGPFILYEAAIERDYAFLRLPPPKE